MRAGQVLERAFLAASSAAAAPAHVMVAVKAITPWPRWWVCRGRVHVTILRPRNPASLLLHGCGGVALQDLDPDVLDVPQHCGLQLHGLP